MDYLKYENLFRWSRTPLNPLLKGLEIPEKRLEDIAEGIQTRAKELTAEEKVKLLVNSINDRSSDMVGEVFSTESVLNIVTGEAEDLLRSIRLFVDDSRPVNRTSLGTQNVLYLSLLLEEMSRRNADSNRQQLLLALEEPEAHIHPHVQRSVFRYFEKQRETIKSLIITTHSPHIVSVAPLRSIVVLRDDSPKNGSKAYRVSEIFDESEIKDLERYLDVTRAELIFARGIIFVEGIAEQYLVPAFAKATGLNLDHAESL
jgi:putative ATP-dependent endonuclease of OLD family